VAVNYPSGALFRLTLRRLDLANAVYHIRKPQKIPLVMSPDETRRLLAVASNLKVRTLLSLGYGCGLRASEVVRTDAAARSSLAPCPSVSRSIQARDHRGLHRDGFRDASGGGFRKRPDAAAANRPICLLQRAAGP
jgi:integrase/recombinase XerD